MFKRALYLSFVISAVLFGATFSCGPAKKTCGPSNCVGCCDTSGNCAIGVAASECGASGVACAACTGGQICTLGACRFPNSAGGGSAGGGIGGGSAGGGSAGGGTGGGASGCAQTCAGCCQGNTCLGGTANTACGVLGLACSSCSGSQTCQSGVCIDQTCNGCVANGTCTPTGSQTNTQCGSFGVSCVDCASSGATCSGGSCTGGVCGGCRDFNGACQQGDSRAFCGSNGNSCVSCTSPGQICSTGACVSGASGGGAGGGGASGGGVGGGGASGGGAGGGGGANPGESCLNPESLGFTTVFGTTTGYVDNYQGTCGGIGADHVYSLFVSSGQARIDIASLASGFFPEVYVRSSVCSTGTELACDASGSASILVGSGSYYVFIDSSDGSSGDYQLSVSPVSGTGGGAGGGGGMGGGVGGGGGAGGGGSVGGGAGGGTGGGVPPSPGDTCATALSLSFVNGTATATNDTTNFNNDYVDPATSSCTTGGQDLVYTFSTQTGGSFTATATGTSTNLYPALYLRNTACSSWNSSTTSLSCTGGGIPTANTSATLGPISISSGTYYLVVDGDSVTYPGPFDLSVTLQ